MLDKTQKQLFPQLGTKKLRKNFQKMLHSAEKCKKGDLLGFMDIHSVTKYQKIEKGTFLRR